MKRASVIVLLVVLMYLARCFVLPRVLPPGDIEYHGEKIKLAKWYYDYEDYENDFDNLDPSERDRIEKLVTSAPIGRHFAGRMQMIRAVSAIRFPGYGQSQFGEKSQSDGSVLAGYSVEIPLADKDRILLFRGQGETYTLLDDFIAAGEPQISRVRQEGNEFVYGTREGQDVLRRRAGSVE